jgi:nicotinamide-nucleotide amidase
MRPARPEAADPGAAALSADAASADTQSADVASADAANADAANADAASADAASADTPSADAPSDEALRDLSRRLGAALLARGWSAATAESCTGGWVAKALTDIPGSSDWFGSGFVTYSNGAKVRMLGVPAPLIASHGAVSEPVVRAMAEGAQRNSAAEVAVAVSGVAGPGGGTDEKPVGLVWFAWASADGVRAESRRFEGDREAVRRASVEHALQGLLAAAEGGEHDV